VDLVFNDQILMPIAYFSLPISNAQNWALKIEIVLLLIVEPSDK
jgi:hypothetical protein